MSEVKFNHVEEWGHRVYADKKQVGFVKIKRWSRGAVFENEGEKFVWNVYASFFPDHKRFAALCTVSKDNYMGHEVTAGIPLHGGQTYHRQHRDESGEIVAVEVGCDYAHYGDEHYERYATLEDAYDVKRDAIELIEYVKETA